MPDFFAPCPRGLEKLLADELIGFGAAAVRHTEGGVALRGRLAVVLSRQSAKPSRVAHPVARERGYAVSQRAGRVQDRVRSALGALVRRERHHSGQSHRHQMPAQEPGIHHAQDQGCGVRQIPRREERASQRGQARSRHAHPCLLRGREVHAVSGYFRRCAVQARRAHPHQHCAAARKPCRRHFDDGRLEARHPAARPDVRQRHLSHRSGADVAQYPARHRAQFCLREIEEFRCRRPGMQCAKPLLPRNCR